MMTSRDLAFGVLSRWSLPHEPPFVPERADPVWAGLPARQRPAALDLITGVMRWRGALDAIVGTRLRQPVDSLDLPVRAILWLGTYQLLFQEHTADYAAVDSTVELAHKHTPAAAGLVNAVLRGITRLEPKREKIFKTRPAVERLSRRTLAVDFSTQLRFNVDIFPRAAKELTAHLTIARSHPPALVDHLRTLFGDALTCDLLLRNNQRPVITLRLDSATLDAPAAAGLAAHAEAERFLIAGAGWNDTLESLIGRGVLSPQDPASAKPVRHAEKLVAEKTLAAPARILDLCAGLGTKSLQLARAFPQAQVVAADIDSDKLGRLLARAAQAGQKNISTLSLPASSLAADSFQLVLADVPCSNTGVIARRVQSRWRWPTLNHPALATLQMGLLAQAGAAVSPGGSLVYATCSIDPAENQQRIQRFLAGNATFRLLAEEATLPSLDTAADAVHDGGYFAILQRQP